MSEGKRRRAGLISILLVSMLAVLGVGILQLRLQAESSECAGLDCWDDEDCGSHCFCGGCLKGICTLNDVE